MADVIDGPHRANAAAQWLGSLPNRDEIAKRESPLTYIRGGLPPILTIHGDADPLFRLKGGEATAAAIPGARLVVYPGMGHGALPRKLWPAIINEICKLTGTDSAAASRAAF